MFECSVIYLHYISCMVFDSLKDNIAIAISQTSTQNVGIVLNFNFKVNPVVHVVCKCMYVSVCLSVCMYVCMYVCMLNKNSLAVKKVRGQSEATNISDQKL